DNLQFACGDGFWYTLANGLGEKEQVDLLIKNYLRRGGKVNVANNSGDYKTLKEGDGLIHALILARNTQCLQRILELGANPSALPLRENDGEYPLILAARLGYMNAVRLLVERACVDVMACKGPDGMSVLHAATMTDSLELFEYLVRISERQLLHEIDAKGATVLHYACKSGFLRLITYLVRDCGLPPDMADSKGETPLHYAIRSMRAKTVVKLVSHLGAQVNPYVYKQVMTPYELARAGG
ncbi:ankyrin repeat-containing domain protein, partial [Gongronella butleri]